MDTDWAPIAEVAPLFLGMEGFDRQERGYKLEVAEAVVELATAVRAGADPWTELKAALRHKENNLISWQLADKFLKWADQEQEDSLAALKAIFDPTVEPLVALGRFLETFPNEIFSGKGTRLSLASFLLMGVNAADYPIYRSKAVKDARQLSGWLPKTAPQTEVDEYADAVAMFDSFRQAAVDSGVPVRDTLEAQGLLYASARWEPNDEWPIELSAKVRKLRKDRGLSESLSLSKAIAEYDRAGAADRLAAAVEQRNDFVERFPVNSWQDMPLTRYILGHDDFAEGVSYGLEWGTKDCGSISGGSAYKHLLFFAHKDGVYRFDDKYSDHEEAWQEIRAGFTQLIELASRSDFSAIDEIDSIWKAPAVRTKLAWMYLPDQLLPIYSNKHLDFWLSIFDVDASKLDRVAKNRALFEAVSAMPEFEGWQSLEIMHFLYSWTDPHSNQTILKISPGESAALWDDCLNKGYIRVGWGEVGDLSAYEKMDELRSEFTQQYPSDNKGSITISVRNLWSFRNLEEGDIVVANGGTKNVLGIGRVTGSYFFDKSLEDHQHTMSIDWFDTTERTVEFGSAWMRAIVPIKPDDYHRILRGSSGPKEGKAPLPAIPELHLEAEKLLDRSGQIIFYGPPGTGKTYAARRHAAWLLGGGSTEPEAAQAFGAPEVLRSVETELLRAQETDGRPSWLVVANPSHWSFDQLFEKGAEQYDYGRLKRNYEDVQLGDEVFGYEATPNKKIVARARISRTLYTADTGRDHIDIEPVDRPTTTLSWDMLKEDPVLAASEPLSQRMQGTLFRLEPQEAARLRELAGFEGESVESDVAQLTRVTFHPTYSYEDFIEGYKPAETGSGGLELTMRDGVFKRVCKAATADPDRPYVLMIDEINRGNVPKIFGELITLIEKDKRGLKLTLPQSGHEFHVPENVHIIATMNTADRSIHILDSALRRRFAFVELMPDPSILSAKVGPLPLEDFLRELNARIRERVGREKQVGHAVLMKNGVPIEAASEFALSFKYELLPLLQEYTYGNYNDLAELLGPEVVDEDNQVPNHEVIDDAERLVEALAKHLEVG